MKRVTALLLSTILLLSGCNAAKDSSTLKDEAKETSKPQEVYIMAGKIEAGEKADLTTKITAKVSKVAVDVGAKVQKGDPLVYLDVKDIEAQVNQAQAGVSTARANLVKVESGARPEQVIQAQAALESAQKNYDTSKLNLERTRQLFNTGAVSQQQMDATETQFAAADAQYKSAQEQLKILSTGETKETLEVLKAQVTQAQAALELAQTQLANGTIYAPIDGIVTYKNINEGEVVSSVTNATLFSIVNTSAMYINAYVPPALTTQMKQGQGVVIKVSENPDKKYQGEISVINSAIDSRNKNVLVKIILKDIDPVLKPGMFAQIALKN